jgi:hypothetical protein
VTKFLGSLRVLTVACFNPLLCMEMLRWNEDCTILSRLADPSGERDVDSWIPDDDKPKKIDAIPEKKVEVRPAFSTNCVKCGTYTAEHPELRGWWPAIDGKLCAEQLEPPDYANEVLTWYCKQCYIQKNDNILVRAIRKLFT